MYVLKEAIDILTQNLIFYREYLHSILGKKSLSDNQMKALYNCLNEEMRVVEDIFEFRIKRVNEMEHPYLPPVVHTEYYLQNLEEETIPINTLVENFLNTKEKIIKYISLISPSRYSRTGYHWQEGHISLEMLLDRYIKNDQKFKQKIEKLLF